MLVPAASGGGALAESPAMTHREIAGRPAQPLVLPIFARLAPALPPELIAARIEAATAPDDAVVDLFGRGGWVARTALALGRRAVSIETSPLTRLLADVVVRAPDLRHLDAAFQAVAAAPLGTTSLRAWIDEQFATPCPTCGRTLALEELVWEPDARGALRPTRRSFRCPACLDRRGRGGELRHAAPGDADVELATAPERDPVAREEIARRFPLPDEEDGLVGQLLGLHSPRQLGALQAILARIEGELRASQVTSALRLALLHAILPASRLNAYPGRASSLRIADGRVRPPGAPGWRERNPWRAFEEGYRLVRAFVQALDDGPYGAVQARLVEPLDGVLDGPPMVSLRVGPGDALARLAAEAEALAPAQRNRVRLVLSQPLPEWTPARLSEAFALTAWVLGSEAARLLPFAALLGPDARPPSRSAALRAGLEAVAPAMAPDGSAVVLLDPDGPPGLIAASLAGAGAGWRVAAARLAEPGRSPGGILSLIPPGGRLGTSPRTRANRALPPAPGGAGDPGVVTTRGLFGGPVPIDGRFSVSELKRVVTEAAVAVLQARGEPADEQHLVGEIVVALDRSGQLRRYAVAAARPRLGSPRPTPPRAARPRRRASRCPGRPPGNSWPSWRPSWAGRTSAASPPPRGAASGLPTRATRPRPRPPLPIASSGPSSACWGPAPPSPRQPSGRGSTRCSPAPTRPIRGWWTPAWRATGSPPRATDDSSPATTCRRGRWSTPPRSPCWPTWGTASAFTWPSPPASRVAAPGGCRWAPASFRTRWSRPWASSAAPARTPSSRSTAAGTCAPASSSSSRSSGRPCWASRSSGAAGGSPPDERLVRFLVLPPERVELVRRKLERSPVLRAAIERFNWHVLRTDALRRFAARPQADPRRPGALPGARPGRRPARPAAALRRLIDR